MKKFAVIMCAAAALIFTGCGEKEAHPEMKIIEYTITEEPLTLDPQIACDSSSEMLIKNLFEGLVREDAEGTAKPGIADSWDVSNDGLEYTFHLAKDTAWSDSSPVTAEDFVFGITRAIDPQTGSENASDLFLIKNAAAFNSGKVSSNELGLYAIDNSTLKITLEYASDNLLHALTLPAAMPCREEFFSKSKGKYGKEPELLITNGPFCIRENYGWDHNKYIYIRRSENYHGANPAISLGVNFTISQQPSDPIAALESEQCDICEIYGSNLSRADEKGLTYEVTSDTLWGICCNTDIKAFKNAKLRVALFGSLNRDELLSDVPDSFVKTSQLVSSKVSFGGIKYRDAAGIFTLEEVQNPSQMYAKALEELDEKGIDFASTYTILSLDDDASSKIVSKMIERWNEVTGCYFNKELLSRSELLARIESGDYDFAVAPLNTAIDSPMEFLSSFRSDSQNNYINLNYPAYDEFIDKAHQATNVNDTIDALKSAESYLIEYGYIFPLYYESRYFAYGKDVSGAIFGSNSETIDFTKVQKQRP
ncbi:MAG: peptide ABC transporter substrate-binding protein [Clostridia bacterium]|nr:peptide ABC transporter substrate-binding protein [Clostridia bacterium]